MPRAGENRPSTSMLIGSWGTVVSAYMVLTGFEKLRWVQRKCTLGCLLRKEILSLLIAIAHRKSKKKRSILL